MSTISRRFVQDVFVRLIFPTIPIVFALACQSTQPASSPPGEPARADAASPQPAPKAATALVDLSGLTKREQLEAYVGREIAFTGKYQNTKQLQISNGAVSIELHRSGAYDMSQTDTVRGTLRKRVVPEIPKSATNEVAPQNEPPGVHYYLD